MHKSKAVWARAVAGSRSAGTGHAPGPGKPCVSGLVHARGMPPRRDRALETRNLARDARLRLGREIRQARLAAGLSLAAAGSAAGMSHAQLSRIERGLVPGLTIDKAFGAAAVVGLRIGISTFPDGDPARDAPQLRLLARFRVRLPPSAGWSTEVVFHIPGDRRAWDAVVTLGGRRAGCEAETRLADIQALDRRLALKERDGGVDTVILLVADTAHNRSVLALHREALRAGFPLDGADLLTALRAGRLPDRNALLVI
jgi:transcriptional regulator with XRE-family HTH domain